MNPSHPHSQSCQANSYVDDQCANERASRQLESYIQRAGGPHKGAERVVPNASAQDNPHQGQALLDAQNQRDDRYNHSPRACGEPDALRTSAVGEVDDFGHSGFQT